MYYKLAITDIRMPCINGIQLYQVLKILNSSIKIMFITSLDAANELSNIYSEVKSQDIIRKPVEGNQFVQMVNDKVKTIYLRKKASSTALLHNSIYLARVSLFVICDPLAFI